MTASLTPEYFDEVYCRSSDPWNFQTSPYEREKYAATIAALENRHYTRGLEIGCSIGILTAMLAPLCDYLLSVDVNETALVQARQRCIDLKQVEFRRMSVPGEFPDASFDLVVMSEVGYYWSLNDLDLAQQRIAAHLLPGGTLLLVHWTPPVPDYPLTGDAVHDSFLKRDEFHRVGGHVRDTYRLDVLVRNS